MEIRGKGVSFARVCEIVAEVSKVYDGNVIVHPDAHPAGEGDYGFAGRLRCVSSDGPGARRSWSGRRTPSACWHAYRDVLKAVFAEYPHATARTAMARYTGADFESQYPRTADHNIGSMMQPAYMPDLCECDE